MCWPHQHRSGPVEQGPVSDVGVAGNPPDVGRAEIDIFGVVVEGEFEGGGRIEHVASGGVQHSLWLA